MGFLEVAITGIALAMDACAVSMTNGMTDSKMPLKRVLLIALFFGFFQFLMPVIGFYITHLVAGAFQETFEKIAGVVAFVLLAFLGGKMIVDCVLEHRKACACQEEEETSCGRLPIVKLLAQAVATSIDALAVGVTLRMSAINGGLPMGVWLSTGLIGVITFGLAIGALYIGKAVGNRFAEKATLLGGVILIIMAIKMLFS